MEKTLREVFVPGEESDQIARPVEYHRKILNSNARLWMTCTLFAADMLGLLMAILVGLEIRGIIAFTFDLNHDGIFVLLALTLAISYLRKGLYPAVGFNYVEELREIISSTCFAFLIVLGVTFVFKTTSIYSRLVLLMVWALSLVLIPLARYLMRRFLIRLRLWGEPVAIIADLQQDLELVEYLRINLQLGLLPVAVLRDEYFSHNLSNSGPSMSIPQIKEFAGNRSLNTVLVVINDLNQLDALVDRYRFVFKRVILVKVKNGSYSLNTLKSLDFSEFLGLEVNNNLLGFWPQLLKRLIDLLGSTLGLFFLSPFFGLTALLIKIDEPGRVFYRQRRLGRDGRTFDLLKFRTMHLNADQFLAEELARDAALKQEWDHYQKLKKDPRITRVGNFLRRFSLDELPQLWNVLKGEMSLVGPRPMMVNQTKIYGDSYKEYIRVSPGITGLWQVSGRNSTTFARRAELDAEYIQRWSPWLDIFILLKTIKIVFWRKGAY